MAPFEPAVTVDLQAGIYEVSRRRVAYGDDVRVGGFRAVLLGTEWNKGDQIGESWSDTATQGFCDIVAFTDAMPEDHESDYFEVFEDMLVTDDWSVVDLDPKKHARLFVVGSGFGDGSFPVFELLSDGNRVGVEVETIAPGTPYPF